MLQSVWMAVVIAAAIGAFVTIQPTGVAGADVAGAGDYYAPPPAYYAPLPQDFDPLTSA